MNSPPQRPLAVWIAMIVIALYIVLLILAVLIPPYEDSVLNEPDLLDKIIGTVEVAATIVSWLVALVALATRRQWGRWFVAAPVVYMIGVYGWEYLTYGLDSDLIIGAAATFVPLVIVILLVSTGKAVNTYFSQAAVPNNATASEGRRHRDHC